MQKCSNRPQIFFGKSLFIQAIYLLKFKRKECTQLARINHGILKNQKKIKNFDFSVIIWHIRSTPNIIKLLTGFLACFIEYHKKVQYLWFNFRGCNCSLNIVVAIFWALLTTLGVLLGYWMSSDFHKIYTGDGSHQG